MISQIILLSLISSTLAQKLPYPGIPDDSLLVKKLDSGFIRGRKHVTENGVEGYVFLSIPVAEAPVGDLRFKKPVPRKPWDGLLNTTEYTVSCYWNSTITTVFTDNFKMDEDCIQTHIYTNEHCLTKGGCAVAFYVHGGDFGFGTPLNFNHSILVDNFGNSSRNIVFVTPSFREVAFGILNLNWKLPLSADLNPGFHDVVFQLQWVKDNIHLFGGDADRITVLGHSGGANIVNLMTISPAIQNMFRQAAILSRGIEHEELIPDRNQGASRMTSQKVGCTSLDIYDPQWEDLETVEGILNCLRNKSALEISSIQKVVESAGYPFMSVSIDYGEGALLPTIYEVLDKSRKPMPLLTGTVSKEFLDSKDTVKSLTEVDQTALRNWCYKLLMFKSYATSESAMQACMVEYNTTSRSLNLNDDILFYVPQMELAVSAANQGAPVYVYQFEYEDIGDAFAAGKGICQPTREETPGHAMELIYLVGQHLGNFTAKDKQIQYLYSQIFADFINHGTPSTSERKWDKFDATKLNYFVIDYPDPTLENPGMKDNYHRRAVEFWHEQFPKVAGSRKIVTKESEFFDIMFPKGSNSSLAGPVEETQKESETNWELLFWIAFALFILTLVVVAFVWIIVNRRKSQYQSL